MPEVIQPTWADLQQVVSCANSRLIVCSPFYSAEGVGHIFDNLNANASLHFWTRLSPSDWAAGVSDPDQLLTLFEVLGDGGIEVKLGILQRLHAKAYAADHTLALIGSANLSGGGFGTNLEIAVRLHGEEAANAITALESICLPNLRTISLEQLRTWVTSSSPIIEESRQDAVEEPDRLASVQEKLDEILNFGGVVSPGIIEPDLSDEDSFVGWLRNNEELAGAATLLPYYDNVHGDNRRGHFHQSFFASIRFLTEYPNLQHPLSEELNYLASDEIYQMSTPSVTQLWLDHIDAHATDKGTSYSYPTLRNILSPSLGGTYTRGGGAGSVMKRMLPLVAQFMQETKTF